MVCEKREGGVVGGIARVGRGREERGERGEKSGVCSVRLTQSLIEPLCFGEFATEMENGFGGWRYGGKGKV